MNNFLTGLISFAYCVHCFIHPVIDKVSSISTNISFIFFSSKAALFHSICYKSFAAPRPIKIFWTLYANWIYSLKIIVFAMHLFSFKTLKIA